MSVKKIKMSKKTENLENIKEIIISLELNYNKNIKIY